MYGETAAALSRKHGYPLDEQLEFAQGSKRKPQDYRIVDYIERNARDPMRKLGPDDRLVGSARMVESYGVAPENLPSRRPFTTRARATPPPRSSSGCVRKRAWTTSWRTSASWSRTVRWRSS